MELSPLQQKIINAPYNKIIVVASAASGKTRCMTEKVRQLLRAGVNPRDIAVITFTNMAAGELRTRLGDDYKDGLFVGTIHALANYMLCVGGIDTSKVISQEKFDKLFDMIVDHPECIKHYEWILLDEAQDSDEMQFKFLFNMIDPPCFFVCGDIKQCQPKGTQITLYNNTIKNIEDLQIGDKVISYSLADGRFHGGTTWNSINNKVTNIEHHYSGEELIQISLANDYRTVYTPGHIAITKLDNFQKNYLVYLMCDKNNRFRVGKSQFSSKNNCNIYRKKMIAENCTKLWIIQTFATDKEARLLEDRISYFYRIPQVTFQTNKITYTQEDIDFIYEGLDTYTSAEQCLKDFHRDIRFPFCSANDNIHYASNAYSKCYACNILPDNMSMLCYAPGTKHRKSPQKISNIQYLEPQEVYSIEVENNHTYVADGILTHNCIYQWRGSQPELLEDLGAQEDVHVMSLNENYRNGNNILSYAKRIIRPTGLADNSIAMHFGDGKVIETVIHYDDLPRRIRADGEYGDWAILCRKNDQVAMACNELKKAGIPYDSFKQGDLTNAELSKKMQANTVKVLTIHSAKGLEWNKVIVIGTRFTPVDERNVNYVAATRARDLLVWNVSATPKNKMRSW